jgi:hypothetical protein
MMELPFIFASGLLGASHCIGMCGPFAIVIGAAAPSARASLVRQVLYGCGRVFTYCGLGAAAGYAGLQFDKAGAQWVNATAILACAAGLFLVVQGLATAGVIKRRGRQGETVCTLAPLLRDFLASHRRRDVFLAGMFTGFLPCGLLYGMLALAAATGNVGRGLLVMGVFGLGTMPLMTLTGLSGILLRVTARQRLLRLAAWSVVLAGFITLGRGLVQLGAGSVSSAAASCPMCAQE